MSRRVRRCRTSSARAGACTAAMISNDPAALEAACSAVLAEGGISEDLRAWQIRCLILMGAGDADFLDQARRAAHEIPKAERPTRSRRRSSSCSKKPTTMRLT